MKKKKKKQEDDVIGYDIIYEDDTEEQEDDVVEPKKKKKSLFSKKDKNKDNKEFYPGKVYRSFKRFPRNLVFMYNMKYNSHKRYLVEMRMRNGDEQLFYVFPKTGVFIFDKGAYIIDDSMARFNLAAGCYKLNYHQDFSLPIKIDYDVQVMTDMVSDPAVSDMKTSLNPATLEHYTRSKVVQNMMTGAGLPEMIKRILMVVVIGVIISIAILLIVLNDSGLLQGVI